MVPEVTVLMAVYNGERYLELAIESILNQTYTNFEFIIVNDGSTDKTEEILNRYADQDFRIKLMMNEKNVGLPKSLNKGMALARGQYIARQDADDVSLPWRLEKQVNFLRKRPEVVLVSAHYEVIDAEGLKLELRQPLGDPGLIAWHMLFVNYIGGHSLVVFRRLAVIDAGGYNEAFRYAQDYELWSRLLKVGKIAILPQVLLKWRTHAQSISAKSTLEQTEYALKIAKNNIEEVTDLKFKRDRILKLRNFWLSLPLKSEQVDSLNNDLNTIFQSFIMHHIRQEPEDKLLPKQIRSIICKQLLYCARGSSLLQTLWLKLRVLPVAFVWRPLATFEYWAHVVWKLVRRTSHLKV